MKTTQKNATKRSPESHDKDHLFNSNNKAYNKHPSCIENSTTVHFSSLQIQYQVTEYFWVRFAHRSLQVVSIMAGRWDLFIGAWSVPSTKHLFGMGFGANEREVLHDHENTKFSTDSELYGSVWILYCEFCKCCCCTRT